jgi:hypothetical protein
VVFLTPEGDKKLIALLNPGAKVFILSQHKAQIQQKGQIYNITTIK